MLNENLRKYRRAKDWTQDELAMRSGYSRSSIINWETGKRAPRSVDIARLAAVLGVSQYDLIGNSSMNNSPDTNETATKNPAQQNNIQLSLLDAGQRTAKNSNSANQSNSNGFAYWGGVVDRAMKLVETKNLQEMKIIAPLLKLAYEAVRQAIEVPVAEHEKTKHGVSAYNGVNSVYNGNALNVGTV